MKQSVFLYESGLLERLTVDARGPIRWVAWKPDAESALLVGDRGSLFEYAGRAFLPLESGTGHNLRCVGFHPDGDAAYACGNSGTLILVRGGRSASLSSDSRTTLRRLAWNHSGRRALVVGNGGAAFLIDRAGHPTGVTGADTNLRSIAWRPGRDVALVTGNCFRDSIGGLTPSHNLFELKGEVLGEVSDLEASRADLTAASWSPDGSVCLVAGFDQTWHTATMLSYSQGNISEVTWGEEGVFPTACAWNPSGDFALVGTAPLTADEGSASLYRFEPGTRAVARVAGLNGYGVSCIAWRDRDVALIACSRRVPAYSV